MKKQGLTLIEVLISLAVFAVLMTAAAASILGSIDANQKAQSINSIMSNMTIALESISRDIRVGSGYAVANGIPLVNTETKDFYYVDDRGVERRIYFDNDFNDGVRGAIMVQSGSNQAVPLTASEVNVKDLQFDILVEDDEGDEMQPAVRIQIWGEVNVQDRTASNFYLQTFVSQRLRNDEI